MYYIEEIEQNLLNTMDDQLDQASDDWLFASGYLRGHITLAIAQLLTVIEKVDALPHKEQQQQVKQQVEQSLRQAIIAGELSPEDQQCVQEVWQRLYLRITFS